MTGKRRRDTRPANWKRTLARLRRNIEELRRQDCEVIEPENFATPPHLRIAQSSTDT